MSKKTTLSLGALILFASLAIAVYAATDASQRSTDISSITCAKVCDLDCGKACETCEGCDGNCKRCEGDCEDCDGNCKGCRIDCGGNCEDRPECVRPRKGRGGMCGGHGCGI